MHGAKPLSSYYIFKMINSEKIFKQPPIPSKKKALMNTTYLYSLKGHRGAAAHRLRVLRS